MKQANHQYRIFYAVADSATAQVQGSRIWYYNLYLPLCDLGHDVIRFDYDLAPHTKHRDMNVASHRDFVKENRPVLEQALLTQIERAHAEAPIDLFFSYFYAADITPATIAKIHAMGITTVNWYCNGSYQFDLVAEIAPAYDYCLVPEKFRLADYQRIGANPIYCQEAANPNVYMPYNIPYEFDVTFVGQKYGDRPAYIGHLLKQDIDVASLGSPLAE